MPSASRKAHNERIAREKALYTHVYISGLSGHHTLETGLAYYYRGHYIYAYPAGNLVEPIPYSTRKGIMIQGIVSESAPVYEAKAEELVGEGTIRALDASIEKEREAKEEVADSKVMETAEALTASKTPPLSFSCAPRGDVVAASGSAPPSGSVGRGGVEDLPPSITSVVALRESAPKTFTPHYGAKSLAASAPGSRLASRAASPAGLRPISSHVGLARLGSIRGPPHSISNDRNEADPFTEDASPSISRPASSVGYLYGLGDHALSAEGLPRPLEIGGGARVAPCAIHGENCDGVTTKEPWLTEQTRHGRGFIEELPMVERRGRVMVDWAGLLEEERGGGVE